MSELVYKIGWAISVTSIIPIFIMIVVFAFEIHTLVGITSALVSSGLLLMTLAALVQTFK